MNPTRWSVGLAVLTVLVVPGVAADEDPEGREQCDLPISSDDDCSGYCVFVDPEEMPPGWDVNPENCVPL